MLGVDTFFEDDGDLERGDWWIRFVVVGHV
jgi:hypothetical protein